MIDAVKLGRDLEMAAREISAAHDAYEALKLVSRDAGFKKLSRTTKEAIEAVFAAVE